MDGRGNDDEDGGGDGGGVGCCSSSTAADGGMIICPIGASGRMCKGMGMGAGAAAAAGAALSAAAPASPAAATTDAISTNARMARGSTSTRMSGVEFGLGAAFSCQWAVGGRRPRAATCSREAVIPFRFLCALHPLACRQLATGPRPRRRLARLARPPLNRFPTRPSTRALFHTRAAPLPRPPPRPPLHPRPLPLSRITRSTAPSRIAAGHSPFSSRSL